MSSQTIKLIELEESSATAFAKFSMEVFGNGRFCLWFQRQNGSFSALTTGSFIQDGAALVAVPDTEHDEEDRLQELDDRIYAVLAEFTKALQSQRKEEALELEEALDSTQEEPKPFR